jgi:hypothetical protein
MRSGDVMSGEREKQRQAVRCVAVLLLLLHRPLSASQSLSESQSSIHFSRFIEPIGTKIC